MRKSYAVFGLGEFGKSVALELTKMGVTFIIQFVNCAEKYNKWA